MGVGQTGQTFLFICKICQTFDDASKLEQSECQLQNKIQNISIFLESIFVKLIITENLLSPYLGFFQFNWVFFFIKWNNAAHVQQFFVYKK